ncbi:MAG: amidohydrolase [Firmicutes bacterium]|nr:amidohydrolase [Bacillota bacterium]
MEDMEKQVDSVVLELKEKLEGISDYIFEHPELGDEEYLSSQYLVNILLENGFKVQYPYLGVQTAFRAELGDDDGITIAFLAEYDALPYCGEEKKAAHTCGHNWIAGSTVGAALALSKIKEVFTGKVVVLGTPAEETIGRKIDLVNKGAFDDIDAVFQMHLCETTNLKAKALAMDSWGFEFKGKASHAAAYPHEGINALDAINLTFAGINALRQQLKPDVRIHGIITEGGEAPNIIPERCTCQFYVRSEKRSYLTQVSEKVKNCAKGAALMTGAKLDIKQFENSYDDLVLNSQLIELMHKNLKKAGFEYK